MPSEEDYEQAASASQDAESDSEVNDHHHNSRIYKYRGAVRPVTIKQILGAHMPHSEGPFTISGNPVMKVTIVSHIIEEAIRDNGKARAVKYTLEDGTGRLHAWYDTTIDTPLVTQGAKLPYVRVIGIIQSFGIAKDRSWNRIKVESIRIVKDFHEIYFHLLEAAVVTHTLERGTTTSTSGTPSAAATNGAASEALGHSHEAPTADPVHSRDGLEDESHTQSAAAQTVIERTPSPTSSGYESAESGELAHTVNRLNLDEIEPPNRGRDPLAHLDEVQRDVMLAIYENHENQYSDDHGNSGVYVRDIANKLRRYELTQVEIAALLDSMIDSGSIVAVDEKRLLYRPADGQDDLHYFIEGSQPNAA